MVCKLNLKAYLLLVTLAFVLVKIKKINSVLVKVRENVKMVTKRKQVPLRFELRSPDSESGMLTITPQDHSRAM